MKRTKTKFILHPKNVLYLFIGLLTIASIFYACKNEIKSATGDQEIATTKLDEINFFNSNFNSNSSTLIIKHNFTKSETNNSIYGGTFTLDNIDFKSFFSKINFKLGFEKPIENVVSFVLYINNFQKDISEKSIEGISFFINSEQGLGHRFFLRKASGFEEVSDARGVISSITTSDLDVLLNHSLKNKGKILNPAYFTFKTPYTKQNDELSSNGQSLSKILIDNDFDIQMFAEGGCGECSSGDGGCVKDENGEEMCDECASSQTEEVAEKNNIAFDVNATFSKSLAYDFRDNFLKKNSIGKKYVNYYYKLSYFTKAKSIINKENFWRHISLGIKLYEVAKKLQYGENNEIVISDTFTDEVVKMIKLYKGETNNNSLNIMFNDIQNDIELFKGKTRAEVLTLIK